MDESPKRDAGIEAGPEPSWPAIPRYVERLALILAIVLGLLSALSTVNVVYQAFKWSPRVDFTMYHNAAQTVLAHESLYHFHEPGGYRAGSLPYPYPPFFASLLAPMGKISLGRAYYSWVAFLILCLGLLVWLTAKIVEQAGGPRPWLLALGVFSLSFFLLDSNLYWGQVNIPVMTLVAGGLLLTMRGRSGWAGVCIGLAAAIKLLPAAILLWFLVRRDWRATASFLATFLASVVLVPMVAAGPGWMIQANREWLDLLLAALTKGGRGLQSNGGYIPGYKNGSIVAIADRMFGGGGLRGHLLVHLHQSTIDAIAKTVRLGIVLASTIATAFVSVRRDPPLERWLAPLAFSLLILAGWLINLLMWDHHTIGLLLILPVVAGAALDGRLDPSWRRPLWVGLIAGSTGLASGWFPGSRIWGLQTLCFFITWACIGWALIRAPLPKFDDSPLIQTQSAPTPPIS